MRLTRRAEHDRLQARTGLLRPQQVHSRPGWTRVGLVATGALLLGGDRVDLEVEVGPGTRLELFEATGTVAYPGQPASWRVRARVGSEGRLILGGLPLVVCAQADVDRAVQVDLEEGAAALVRDTLVLGRARETGGRGRLRTLVGLDGRPVLVEEQALEPTTRALPGILGEARVVDSVWAAGRGNGLLQTADDPPGAATSRWDADAGWSTRWLGSEVHRSPLHHVWEAAATALRAWAADPTEFVPSRRASDS